LNAAEFPKTKISGFVQHDEEEIRCAFQTNLTTVFEEEGSKFYLERCFPYKGMDQKDFCMTILRI
jgi:hypothetical protein